MAKNIFVRGDFKQLREQIRRYKKDEQRLAQNLLAFNQRENIFLSRDWTADNRSAFLQEKYFLAKEKTLLEVEKVRLANLKLALQRKQADLDSLCQKPDSLNKIEEIAAGILRKNFKFVRMLEETENRECWKSYFISELILSGIFCLPNLPCSEVQWHTLNRESVRRSVAIR